jgi:hypothetical protein
VLKRESNIDIEKFKKHISYNPDTGEFYWILPTSHRVSAGDKVLSVSRSGYYELCFMNQKAYQHRVAWMYVYGVPPNGVIDHINGIKTDNRIVNLRCVSQMENSQNILKAHKSSKTGVRGVYKNRPNTWVAQIRKDGKAFHLGSFKTLDEAKSAYLEAKKQFHSAPALYLCQT